MIIISIIYLIIALYFYTVIYAESKQKGFPIGVMGRVVAFLWLPWFLGYLFSLIKDKINEN